MGGPAAFRRVLHPRASIRQLARRTGPHPGRLQPPARVAGRWRGFRRRNVSRDAPPAGLVLRSAQSPVAGRTGRRNPQPRRPDAGRVRRDRHHARRPATATSSRGSSCSRTSGATACTSPSTRRERRPATLPGLDADRAGRIAGHPGAALRMPRALPGPVEAGAARSWPSTTIATSSARKSSAAGRWRAGSASR